MQKLDEKTLRKLEDYDLRPGMDIGQVRQAMHDHRNHGFAGDGVHIDGKDSGAHLQINGQVYTPGQVKQLLDASVQRMPAAVPESALRALPQIEESIRIHMRSMARSYIAIGRDLIAAKELVGQHGSWMEWLARMGFNQSTANKYMQAAREIPAGSYLEELPQSTVRALLTLPAEDREGFARQIGAEDKTAAEIKRLIAEREQLKRERDAMASAYEKASNRATKAEVDAYNLQQQLNNAEPRTVKVVEVPDDYQALKMQAARHESDLQEALDAAEAAEQRAADAEAALRRERMQQGGAEMDEFTRVQGAVNTFLMAVQMLPYNPVELGGMYNRQRYAALLKPVFEWCEEMRDRLENGGALDAEAEIV